MDDLAVARVAALAVHPVKSCAAMPVQRGDLDETGLRVGDARDREWMVVDVAGRFVTQRECEALARVRATPSPSGLALDAPGQPPLRIARAPGSVREVVVWRDTVRAIDAGDDAARWLSSALHREVRLVRFDASARRLCNPAYAGDGGAHTLFADGYPILVIGASSLDELNARLARRGEGAVAMVRFRPNVVLEGLAPHDEDHVATIETACVRLRLVKPCTRCRITTIDPATGVAGDEPLATLAGYRMDERTGGVTFGMNAIVERAGPIAVGDAARVTFRF